MGRYTKNRLITGAVITGAVVAAVVIAVLFIVGVPFGGSRDEGVKTGGYRIADDSDTIATGGYLTTPEPALKVLETIPVKGRASATGYQRTLFGPPWTDNVDVEGGYNGCDTRNDILQRDLTGISYVPGRTRCKVAAGWLDDPYTGMRIHFFRGRGTSNQVQIDHIVAMKDAWQKGAQQWDGPTRVQFANDPLNLLAVNGRSNEQKGESDIATWLPLNKAFRCEYVTRVVEVKAKYGVWMTQAEHDTAEHILNQCALSGH